MSPQAAASCTCRLAGIKDWRRWQALRQKHTDKLSQALPLPMPRPLLSRQCRSALPAADLALVLGTHVLLVLAIAAMCTHAASKRLYARHRELIVSLGSLHCALACRRISTNGRCAASGGAYPAPAALAVHGSSCCTPL